MLTARLDGGKANASESRVTSSVGCDHDNNGSQDLGASADAKTFFLTSELFLHSVGNGAQNGSVHCVFNGLKHQG